MLYYVKTGSVDITQQAESHKQAAIKTIKEHQDFGKFVIVGVTTIDVEDESQHGSLMFFCTKSLLREFEINKFNNMRLVY